MKRLKAYGFWLLLQAISWTRSNQHRSLNVSMNFENVLTSIILPTSSIVKAVEKETILNTSVAMLTRYTNIPGSEWRVTSNPNTLRNTLETQQHSTEIQSVPNFQKRTQLAVNARNLVKTTQTHDFFNSIKTCSKNSSRAAKNTHSVESTGASVRTKTYKQNFSTARLQNPWVSSSKIVQYTTGYYHWTTSIKNLKSRIEKSSSISKATDSMQMVLPTREGFKGSNLGNNFSSKVELLASSLLMPESNFNYQVSSSMTPEISKPARIVNIYNFSEIGMRKPKSEILLTSIDGINIPSVSATERLTTEIQILNFTTGRRQRINTISTSVIHEESPTVKRLETSKTLQTYAIVSSYKVHETSRPANITYLSPRISTNTFKNVDESTTKMTGFSNISETSSNEYSRTQIHSSSVHKSPLGSPSIYANVLSTSWKGRKSTKDVLLPSMKNSKSAMDILSTRLGSFVWSKNFTLTSLETRSLIKKTSASNSYTYSMVSRKSSLVLHPRRSSRHVEISKSSSQLYSTYYKSQELSSFKLPTVIATTRTLPKDIPDQQTTGIPLYVLAICLPLAALLGFALAFVYFKRSKYDHRVRYSVTVEIASDKPDYELQRYSIIDVTSGINRDLLSGLESRKASSEILDQVDKVSIAGSQPNHVV